MANTKGKYLEESTKHSRARIVSTVPDKSKAHEVSLEDIDLHSSDDDEFEDVGVAEDEEVWDRHDFEFIHNEVLTPSGNCITLPTESFRGTWEGAYQETSRAVSDVKKASQVYASAIANSNITRAGLAISNAITSAANRSALLVANKALEVSGQDESKLPRKVMDWIKTKSNMDEAKRKAATAEKERIERKVLAAAIAEGKVTESLPSRRQSLKPPQLLPPIPQSFESIIERSPYLPLDTHGNVIAELKSL